MSDDEASTSGTEREEAPRSTLFFAHEVQKLDTLAGLAVKYNVSVADIKRVNGLLSDQAMFAKDKLLIPNGSIGPIGLEYSTWAGMIVTQYGRLASTRRTHEAPLVSCSEEGTMPSGRASPALNDLQRYYGTSGGSGRDVSSEPGDFRPGEQVAILERLGLGEYAGVRLAGEAGWIVRHGEGDGPGRSGDVEMTEFEPRECHAGERRGPAVDERLRQRRAADAASSSNMDAGHLDSIPSPSAPGEAPGRRPPLQPGRGAAGGSGEGRGTAGVGVKKKESLIQKLTRVASQPALAGPAAPSLLRAGEAALASAGSGAASPARLPGLRSSSSGGSSVGSMQRAVATVLRDKVPVKKD